MFGYGTKMNQVFASRWKAVASRFLARHGVQIFARNFSWWQR